MVPGRPARVPRSLDPCGCVWRVDPSRSNVGRRLARMKKLVTCVVFLAVAGLLGALPKLSEPWLFRPVVIGFSKCGATAGDDHADVIRLFDFCHRLEDLSLDYHVMAVMASQYEMLIRVQDSVPAWMNRDPEAAEALLLRIITTWHDVLRTDEKLSEVALSPIPAYVTVEYEGHTIAKASDASGERRYYLTIYSILRTTTIGTDSN